MTRRKSRAERSGGWGASEAGGRGVPGPRWFIPLFVWKSYGTPMELLWNPYGTPMELLWNNTGATPEQHATTTGALRSVHASSCALQQGFGVLAGGFGLAAQHAGQF